MAVCAPSRSTRLNDILTYESLSGNPNFELQLVGWQIARSANGEDRYDWGAFRQYMFDVGAPDPGDPAPPEFNPFAQASHYSNELLSKYATDDFFVWHMEDWQQARLYNGQDACDWNAFRQYMAGIGAPDPGAVIPPEFSSLQIPPVVVAITADKSIINNGDTVTFTAAVSGGTPPYSFKWYFGDGSIGTIGPRSTHVYNLINCTAPVTKKINLDVTDTAHQTVRSNDVTVTIGCTPAPKPSQQSSMLPLIFVGGGVLALIAIGMATRQRVPAEAA